MEEVTLLDARFDESDGISLAEFVERMDEADRERGYLESVEVPTAS